MCKVWMVTGSAKGIVRAIVETALQKGDIVIGTTRKENDLDLTKEYGDHFRHYKLDVAKDSQEQVDAITKDIIDTYGRIDVLVNNAGHGCITNFEETDEETIRELFELNLFGLMRVTRSVLPYMRKAKAGHIFNIASAAGYGAGPVAYHTSKFAVTGFSTCLAFEVSPFHIRVTNVAPGLFRTSFYDEGAMKKDSDKYVEDYDVNRWQKDFVAGNSNHEQPGDPVKLAELVYEVACCDNAPLHLPVGKDGVETAESYAKQLMEDVSIWKEKAVNTNFQ